MGRQPGSRNLPHGPCPEADRLRAILRAFITMTGLSICGVRRRVKADGSAFEVGHVLTGRQDIKVWQAIALCRVVGVHPAEVFRMVLLEPPGPSPLVAEVEVLIRPPKADPLRAAVATRLLQSEGIEAERRRRP
jgi:hypothetical protein